MKRAYTFVAILVFIVVGAAVAPRAAVAACGDGIVTGGEECDPGGQLYINGDPTMATCTTGTDCFYANSCCKFNCQFVGQGATCSDGNDCTTNDVCNQVGSCAGSNQPAGTACDDGLFCTTTSQCSAGGQCLGSGDPCSGGSECANVCDEVNDTCNLPAGTACGSATSTQCTAPDTCDGAGTCQGNDAAAGTSAPALCGDGNECTADECNGSGGCQNPNLTAGSACGDPSDTDCTDPDTCNGSGTCESHDVTAGTPSPGQCGDANECTADQCDGSGGCQNPVLVGNACGDPSDTECTDPDTCDAGGVCQSNDLASGTSAPSQCGDGNECTADECDGSGGCQNPNLNAGSGCGDPTDTQCNGADTCDGAGSCQANVASAGTPAPLLCGDANDCTNDVCDGSGGCNNPFHLLGTACGDPSTLPCSLPDSCDGAGTCRPNDLLDGSVCDDGDVCTSDEICASGVCVPGGVTDCSDGDPCTADSCDPLQGGCLNLFEPDPSCTEGGAGGFSIINKEGGDRDQLRFKWFRGDDDVLYSDLGDPSASTEYQFCVFDTDAGVGSLVHRIDIPSGPFWRLKPEKKMIYRDKSGSAGGLITFKIKAGSKGRFGIKAKGPNLATPPPLTPEMYLHQDPTVTVQLTNTEGQCWLSHFDKATRNNGTKFKTKLKVVIP